MRIIAGKHRGRQLTSPEGDHVRPTADMVRQALFTKLQFFVPNTRVLDLFAGSGAMGIEALSRGASEVVFADVDIRSIRCIRQNLKQIKEENATVINGDFEQVLKQIKGKQFDLIVLDPPYQANFYETALIKIKEYDMLSKNGIIVCEHAQEIEIQTKLFEIVDIKKYGNKKLTYLKASENEEV